MSTEMRDTLLYGQLQEALWYKLMRAPAVSGSTKYQELCMAAKNEEKHLAELCKRQQYSKSSQQANKSKPLGDTQKYARSDCSTPAPMPRLIGLLKLGSITILRRPITWYVTVERRKVMMLTEINILAVHNM